MAKTNKELCGICYDEINKSNRKDIKCLYCNFIACRNCIKQYLLVNINEPNCMNCKNVWNREFLCNNFPKIFINNDYKDYRENLLLDKEKALLPATQPIVEAIYNEVKLTKLLKTLEIEYRTKRLDLINEIRYNSNIAKGEIKVEYKKAFIRKCGVTDCRGFLSQDWKCGICKITTCNKCLEILNQENVEHICKEENIESAKLIAKDSKPCPKCGSLIFKINGCNQMFCTSCNTAFCWKTGQIETKRIHNPHYYEMLRKMSKNGEIPREPGDNQCENINGMPTNQQIESILRKKFNINSKTLYANIDKNVLKIHELTRKIFHILAYYPNTFLEDYEKDKRKLRVKYLMNEITEDIWKRKLQIKEKKYEKSLNYFQIMRTLDIIGGDIIRNIQNKDINSIFEDFNNLRNNINNGLYQIGKQYSNNIKCIDEKWDLVNVKI
jgi:hypothetical protein